MKNYYIILGVSIVLAAGTGIFLYKQHAKWVKNNEHTPLPSSVKPKPNTTPIVGGNQGTSTTTTGSGG